MGIVDWIYPKRCSGCGQVGEYVCLECQKKLIKPEAICPMCCKPSLDGWTHPRCKARYGMDRLIVGLPYRGMVQQALKKVKYQSQWDRISFLFGLWKQKIDLEINNVIVTSVPMWGRKEKERGFNQAEMLSKLVAEYYKVPNLVMLERVRKTKPQYGLKKEERRENIEGAFELMNQYTSVPMQQRVILVDDVWTTGATMRECARVLKSKGIKEIWGITLAR